MTPRPKLPGKNCKNEAYLHFLLNSRNAVMFNQEKKFNPQDAVLRLIFQGCPAAPAVIAGYELCYLKENASAQISFDLFLDNRKPWLAVWVLSYKELKRGGGEASVKVCVGFPEIVGTFEGCPSLSTVIESEAITEMACIPDSNTVLHVYNCTPILAAQ